MCLTVYRLLRPDVSGISVYGLFSRHESLQIFFFNTSKTWDLFPDIKVFRPILRDVSRSKRHFCKDTITFFLSRKECLQSLYLFLRFACFQIKYILSSIGWRQVCVSFCSSKCVVNLVQEMDLPCEVQQEGGQLF